MNAPCAHSTIPWTHAGQIEHQAPGYACSASAINRVGQIVGYTWSNDRMRRSAFLCENGALRGSDGRGRGSNGQMRVRPRRDGC